ncbi:MAG: sulfotransferase, partial [Halioglobus sp.]|nr:sulfotransferase [Halioglobus sp.]
DDFNGADSRIPTAKAEVAQMLAANPDLASMHPLDACAPDEEVMLLEQSFYSTLPESFAWLPGYAHWLESHDNTPGYRYLYQLLQFLQWQKKRKGQRATRWLLKAPHHLHHLDLLLQVFPGATVIQTHRDPLQTIPSLCSLNVALASLGSDCVDPVRFARHWSDKFARSMARAIAVRDQFPEQFIDVWYKDIVSDPVGVVRQIYQRLHLALDRQTTADMGRWLRDNSREKRRPHQYTLERFGLTSEGLREDFSAYRAAYLHA